MSALKIQLNDCTHGWKHSVQTAENLVELFFPYVTSIQVINKIPTDILLHLYTVFSLENFAAGGSSFQVLRKIFKRPNTRIYHLEGLHAKLFFVDGNLISLGSQNLTARGAKNLEATVLHPGTEPSKRQLAILETWKADAVLITQSMMDEMKKWLPEIRKAYTSYQKQIEPAERQIAEVLDIFTEERRERERVVASAYQRLDDSLSRLRQQIDEMSENMQFMCYRRR